jgi:hypothetical protein
MLGIVAVAGGYILVKYLRRRLFLQRLRMGEIEADPAPPKRISRIGPRGPSRRPTFFISARSCLVRLPRRIS